MRQRAAASLLYQSQHAEPAFRNLQKLIFLKIVGRILAFYTLSPPTSWLHLIPANAEVKFSYFSLKLGLLKVGKGDSEEVHFAED